MVKWKNRYIYADIHMHTQPHKRTCIHTNSNTLKHEHLNTSVDIKAHAHKQSILEHI